MMFSFVLLALSSLFGEATSCINRYQYYDMCDLQRCRPIRDKEVCAALTFPNTANNSNSSSSASSNNNNNNSNINRVLCIKINELDINHHVEVKHISPSSKTCIQVHKAVNICRFQGREWSNRHNFNTATILHLTWAGQEAGHLYLVSVPS